jgi:predicted metal-dependent HD superfamily phosphohydrolase
MIRELHRIIGEWKGEAALAEPQGPWNKLYFSEQFLDPRAKYIGPPETLNMSNEDLYGVKEIVEAAILLHDAYYDPFAPPGFNERMSADFVWPMDTGHSHTIERLVLATGRHLDDLDQDDNDRGHDFLARLINDIDLTPLAVDWGEFEYNSTQLFHEVDHKLTIEEFNAKRAEFFNTLLSCRKNIFYLEPLRYRYEQRARDNIAKALVTLERNS